MSPPESVNYFLLLLNIYLQFCAVEYTHIYVHTRSYANTQSCGDTCMRIYDNTHFMEAVMLINTSDTSIILIQLLSAAKDRL